MRMRKLGGLSVSAQGLGCMGMSEFYGAADHKAGLETIHRALELGVYFFDTADAYAYGENEKLLGDALIDARDRVVIATKCGIVRDKANPLARVINTTPAYIKKCCEESLARLKTDYIDLFYLHRLDGVTPIEDSMRALAELVAEGKIRHIGLCEVDADTIRRAHAVHPITAVQSEYSLWSRGQEKEVIPTCRELGIGFVAYSPLGRGFLTGEIKAGTKFGPNDFRMYAPRFAADNLDANLALVAKLETLAKEKQCHPAQLALAWLSAKGEDIVPIPGTTKIKHLESNVKSLEIHLSLDEVAALDRLSEEIPVHGERYPEATMKAFKLTA